MLSSASRRSVMPISVGHLRSWSPSSLVKMKAGRPSTLPPPSAPRMAVQKPYLAKASVSLVPMHVGGVHPGEMVVRHRLGRPCASSSTSS